MCKCGCNTGKCETKIRGPLLTEERVRPLVSKNLKYHLDNNIPLTENKYLSLNAYLFLIKEARKLYTRNVLDVNKKDEVLLKAQVGEFTLHENKIVPLDLNLLNEFSMSPNVEKVVDKLYGTAEKAGKKLLELIKKESKQTIYAIKEIAEWVVKREKPSEAEQKKIIAQIKDFGYLASLALSSEYKIFAALYYIIDKSNIADEFLKLDEVGKYNMYNKN